MYNNLYNYVSYLFFSLIFSNIFILVIVYLFYFTLEVMNFKYIHFSYCLSVLFHSRSDEEEKQSG